MGWFKKKRKQNEFLVRLLRKLYEKATNEWERSYRLQGNGYCCIRSLSGNHSVDGFSEYKTNIGSFEIFLGYFHGSTGGSQEEAITEYVLDVVDPKQGITVEEFINNKEVVNLYRHIDSKIRNETAEAEAQRKVIEAENRSRIRHQAKERLNRLLDI